MVQRELLDTRRAVRAALTALAGDARGPGSPQPLVLIALSGGADSLALAAACAREAPRAGLRAGTVIVDHGLQGGSAAVAAIAAEAARGLGLAPVEVRRVAVGAAGGPEAAARDARYAALGAVAAELGASAVLTAHTRDDQAEQVLLALARGSGTRSIAGIPPVGRLPAPSGPAPGGPVPLLRPFLAAEPAITRAVTEAACAQQGLSPWLDPQNADPSFARVRVRRDLLPALERGLGPGVAAALARTADLAREDADALDAIAADAAARLLADAAATLPGQDAAPDAAALPVSALRELPAALRHRVLRRVAAERFGAHLTREHTLAIASLATGSPGRGPVHAPGLDAARAGELLVLTRRVGSPRD